MGDPSRAVIKLGGEIQPLCSSYGANVIGSVPKGQTVALYRPNELLGRWGALEGREKDPEEGENGLYPGTLPPASIQTTMLGRNKKPPKLLRVTHIFDSFFKFNPALAVSEDNPVFVGNGHTCLGCALNQLASSELRKLNKDPGRWIIHYDPNPPNTAPRNRFQLAQSKAKLLAQDKNAVS